VTQLQIRAGYGIPELRTDLSALCLKAGLKKLPTVLLVTDAQLVDETLLGPIHDFLAAGEIPGLFNDDEIDNVVQVRNFILFSVLHHLICFLRSGRPQ
jgi:dynein heavy chain